MERIDWKRAKPYKQIYQPLRGIEAYHSMMLNVPTGNLRQQQNVAVLPSSREEQATYADQVIYKSLHPEVDTTNRPALLGSQNSTAPLVLPSENALEVSGMAEGRMSSVRRTFCLFVLFDLILMFILWVIYTQLIGDTGFSAFEKQVEKYDFRTSLFDTVMLSAIRFTLLIQAYGLFRIRHWWMIAICTLISCCFLIAKIFLFDFGGTKSSNNPLSYCLIIISFVLAWVETWFLDFKVLPREKKLRERIANSLGRVYGATLIGSSGRPAGVDDLQSVVTEDNQFYSPVDSPEDSDTEQETRSARSSRSVTRQASGSSLNSNAIEVERVNSLSPAWLPQIPRS